MFTLIRCDGCGGNPVGLGATSIDVKVDVPQPPCSECHHRDEHSHTYSFCGYDCLLRVIGTAGGFPCKRCRGTGHDDLNNDNCIYCEGKGKFGAGRCDPKDPTFPG